MTNPGQVVEVLDRYAYHWSGRPLLHVDDTVLLPSNLYKLNYWYARVTRLGSDYDGELSEILGLVDCPHDE